MRKRILSLTIFLSLFGCGLLPAQNKLGVYSAAFYNLENLFDIEDDPENPGDDDFTPNGIYHWTADKYQKKLNTLASVLTKLGRTHCPTGPAVIGVSEIENRKVLEDLVNTESLATSGYKVVHFDSPDRRGIDVGLLYNPRLFTLHSAVPYRYHTPDRPDYRSRDQLLVSGTLAGEPFHIIVNHWPSRYGGNKSSIYREAAARITRHIADSLYAANPEAKVLIMGDMNDDPTDKSCKEVLQACKKQQDAKPGMLFNTTWELFEKGFGTLCYNGKWNLYDQQIISANLLGKDRTSLKFWKTEVFNRELLTEQKGKRKGYPKRCFIGDTFQNGYSDHFPTVVYFVKQLP